MPVKQSAPIKHAAAIWLIGFVLVTLAMLASPLASALHWIFPCLAVLTGFVLLRFSPRLYLGFTLWCWILAPLFRRLVDYRSSFVDPSPILIAPSVVTLLCLYDVVSKRKWLQGRDVLPQLLFIGTLFFGVAVGLISHPVTDVARAFLNWFVPVCWGLYLTSSKDLSLSEKRSLVTRHMVIAVLVMGVYGVCQYLFAPGWDKLWLDNSMELRGSTSFGLPEPFEIRVWSTLNGPFVFGGVMLFGLMLIAASKPSVFGLLAAGAGAISFMLSLVRTAWIGFIFGFILLAVWKKSSRLRLLTGIAVVIALLVAVLSLPKFRDKITERVQTISDIQNDGSVQERKDTQRMMLAVISNTPFGQGLTGAIPEKTLNAEPIDSCIFDLLFFLGWPGTAVIGLALILIAKDVYTSANGDEAATGFAAIVFAFLIQVPAGNILIGTVGVFFWTAVSLARKMEPPPTDTIPLRVSFHRKYV